MAQTRINIKKQLEKSANTGSVLRTDTNNELEYLAPSTDGHVLTLVSGTPEWTAPSGGGALALDDLTDADTTTTPPAVGNHLEFDGTNWVPSCNDTEDVPAVNFEGIAGSGSSVNTLRVTTYSNGGAINDIGSDVFYPILAAAEGGEELTESNAASQLDSDGGTVTKFGIVSYNDGSTDTCDVILRKNGTDIATITGFTGSSNYTLFDIALSESFTSTDVFSYKVTNYAGGNGSIGYAQLFVEYNK